MPPRLAPRILAALVLSALALPAAAPAAAAAADAPLRVVVSIPPLAWFARGVAGDLAEVTVLLGPGDSPHTFEPTPRQMAALAGADLFLAAGVPFELALRPRVAALAAGPRIAGPLAAGDHDRGHGDGLDPHTWLDPAGAAAIADTAAAALARLRPAEAARFAAGRAAVRARIDAVDRQVRTILAGREGGTFVVFHPAFGHFAAAYGLEQVAIQDRGHEPGARRLAEVTDLARARGVGAVIVQPQFSQRAAEAVAASIGVPVVELDPLAADWDANMLHLATVLAGVLGRPGGGEARP